MTLISVVIPVFNVAPFVDETLASIAAQTHRDLDVVVVDNGSTDGTDAHVARIAEQDSRFRLLHVAGGGPARARNVGMAEARGELLTFADGDDLVPPNAYELLLTTLQETGSDFVAGNFRRLNEVGVRPAYYMGAAFAKSRMRTHIREFHDLVRDRTLWNKLFRRAFLDKHHLRLVEGADGYEDQYLTLPAYFLAESVDVVTDVVYYWRIRESGQSLSQLRQTPEAICRRLTAINDTSRFLAERFPEEKRWYEQSVVLQDLAPLPEVVAAADPQARTAVLDRTEAWLEQADPATLDDLPAVRRVAWTLVRRRAVDELGELLAFEREALPSKPPIRRRGHWYGDYPFRRDRRLRLPRELFRVDEELAASSRIAAVDVAQRTVAIEGFVRVDALPTFRRGAQELECAAVAQSGAAVPLAVVAVERPELAALEQAAVGPWGGYRATLDLAALGDAGAATGTWALRLTIRRRGLTRTTESHAMAALHVFRPAIVTLDDRRQVRLELTTAGRLRLHVERCAPVLTSLTVDGDVLRLAGSMPHPADEATLRIRRKGGGTACVPVALTEAADGSRFAADVPVAAVLRDFRDQLGAFSVNRPQLEDCDVEFVTPRRTTGLGFEPSEPIGWVPATGREWSVAAGRRGHAVLRQRTPRPTITAVDSEASAGWTLHGHFANHGPEPLLLTGPDRRSVDLHRVDVTGEGGFTVTLPDPAAVGAGQWQLEAAAHPAHAGRAVPLGVDDALLPTLPTWRWADGAVTSAIGVTRHAAPALFAV